MNSFFTQKGNRDNSNKVLKNFEPAITEAFSPYTDLRFDFFKPTRDIQRKLKRNSKKVKKFFIQDRKKIEEKFNNFYDNYCSDFYFEVDDKVKAVLENNEHTKRWQPKDLYNKIKTNSAGKIYFLIGEVGSGKSTYLSSLIREFDKDNINDNQGLLFFVVKFSQIKKFYSNSGNIDIVIIKILLDVLNNYLKENDKIRNYSNVEKFIESCMHTFVNHKLIFAFDDIDQIYDEYNKQLFSYQGVEEEFIKWNQKSNQGYSLVDIIKKLIGVMRKFNGRNIDFILSLRPNTYNISAHTGLGVGNQENECIFIRTDKNSIMTDEGVINNRISMLKSVVTDANFVKGNLTTFVNVSMEHKLHGLRHLIDNSVAVLSKIMNKEHCRWAFEIFTYLDNHDIYTQNRWGGVVNIFLVNSKYRRDEDIPGVSDDYPRYPNYIKTEHGQTYWLKYLISCIFSETGMSDQAMYEKYFTAYERSIYQLCIYSLTEVQHGRLISCVPDKNNKIRSLKSTERLEYCANRQCNNLFFKFTYIAVIVDDAYLQIPNVVSDDEKFMNPWVYKSFLPNNDAEIKEWKDWLEQSVYKVFLFMKILKISWENYEERKISGDLKRYKPDFKEIHNGHVQEINEIATSLNFHDIDNLVKQTLEKQKEYDDVLIKIYSN